MEIQLGSAKTDKVDVKQFCPASNCLAKSNNFFCQKQLATNIAFFDGVVGASSGIFGDQQEIT